jgi:hypothetical protein
MNDAGFYLACTWRECGYQSTEDLTRLEQQAESANQQRMPRSISTQGINETMFTQLLPRDTVLFVDYWR